MQITDNEEIYYSMALTRLSGVNHAVALQLYKELGDAQAVYEATKARLPWDEALRRAEAEMAFVERSGIRVLTMGDEDYPRRLRMCEDAPVVLYYKGVADLNRQRVINIVGTRQCTAYGQDIIRRFVGDLRQLCPDVLIVSGLAYGVDIHAHRNALENGFDTVGVLAHGLDRIYPHHHRDTAAEMVGHGGLLTEYMSQTQALPNNFRQRNRIVAGMSDATILVESAYRGGGLITCRIAQEYGRDVFAFPGAVGMPFSEGCNRMIQNNTAALIMSAEDFIEAMGWKVRGKMEEVRGKMEEGELFPELTGEERAVVEVLRQTNDLQLNMLSVRTNIPVGQMAALLFQLEMKGVVKAYAGGNYHLVN
jgi:DNA processing protein